MVRHCSAILAWQPLLKRRWEIIATRHFILSMLLLSALKESERFLPATNTHWLCWSMNGLLVVYPLLGQILRRSMYTSPHRLFVTGYRTSHRNWNGWCYAH